ncbi:M67 family metallopeptidase [Kovacikia minuta CCNUW1]|uniref:Mov34/MPN/PAD-1 family protein n=1 Tax=Kovacikia minuta TaxID=2931930 RepID=UPI001CD01288|nr:M67 family metallopeptidase [Kovacikia minuta]UBF25919.1 M67 family metallopeptidase [Kovacikia minuta CCNUW1]
MALILSSDHLQAIKIQAEGTYPEECCGLLLGRVATKDKIVVDVWETKNAWDAQVAADLSDESLLTKTERYWIAPEEMLAGMRDARHRNLEVIGIYHSHTDHPAVPSECDRRLAWSQYSYLIISVNQGKAGASQSWMLDRHHQFQSEAIQIQSDARMRRQSLISHL